MISMKEQIIQRLDDLSETSLHKVLDLVEQLDQKSSNSNHDDPILAVIGLFSDKSLSSRDIDRELYGECKIEESA